MPDFDYPTSSPGAGLAAGLAHGIFDYFNTQKKEAKDKEDSERKQSVNFLASLLDKVDDESRPQLLRQIGDVMSLKGKERSIWDRLTGRGLDNNREAIQSRMGSVFQNVYGPEQAKRMKGGPLILAPQTPTPTGQPFDFQLTVPQMQVGETPNTLPPSAIVLDNPEERHMRLMAAQFGLQNKYRQDLFELKEAEQYKNRLALQDDRQAFAKEQSYRNAEIRAKQKIDALAQVYARTDPRGVFPTPLIEHEQKAADYLLRQGNLDMETKEALVRLRGSQSKLAEAQAANIDPLTGKMGPTASQQFTIDTRQQGLADSAYRAWQDARAKADQLGQEHQGAFQQLQEIAKQSGVDYDATTGTFVTGDPAKKKMVALLPVRYGELMKQATKALLEKRKSEAAMQAQWNVLRERFSQYYSAGDSPWDEISPLGGGVLPSGAPRTVSPPLFDKGTATSGTRGPVGQNAPLGTRTPPPTIQMPLPSSPSRVQAGPPVEVGAEAVMANPKGYVVGQRIQSPRGLYEVIGTEGNKIRVKRIQ